MGARFIWIPSWRAGKGFTKSLYFLAFQRSRARRRFRGPELQNPTFAKKLSGPALEQHFRNNQRDRRHSNISFSGSNSSRDRRHSNISRKNERHRRHSNNFTIFDGRSSKKPYKTCRFFTFSLFTLKPQRESKLRKVAQKLRFRDSNFFFVSKTL